jgi:hypothetical protein
MSWLVVGAVFVMVTALPDPAAAQDEPKVELSGGWNYFGARINANETWHHLGRGWYADVAGNLTSTWAVVGQVSGYYTTITEPGEFDTDFEAHPFLFGVRAKAAARDGATPFVQFLAGATHLKTQQVDVRGSETSLTFQAGGGVTLNLGARTGIRVSGDYVRIIGKDDGDVTGADAIHGPRLAIGFVVGLGG